MHAHLSYTHDDIKKAIAAHARMQGYSLMDADVQLTAVETRDCRGEPDGCRVAATVTVKPPTQAPRPWQGGK